MVRKNWYHSTRKIEVGDFYVDCGWIPRFCISAGPDDIQGISLIDRTIGSCSRRYCGPLWVHRIIAERWAETGPISKDIKKRLEFLYNSEWSGGRQIWW